MTGKRQSRRVETSAPTVGEGDAINFGTKVWPTKPPPPLKRPRHPPSFRPLQVYAFGPGLGRTPINIRTLLVRYEPLAPGPIGERIAVVDYDSTRNCFYDPVDLDDPLIAMNGGLDPSESDPRFHQQMVYAIANNTLHRIEVALGRTIRRRTLTEAKPLRVVIFPHAGVIAQSYVKENRMVFGYFQAGDAAAGRTVPGQTVFTCLVTDAVINQTANMIQTAMRPDLDGPDAAAGRGRDTTWLDNDAIVAAVCDLTSLLFHFGYREAVLDTIQRTAGVIYRSQLDVDSDSTRQAPRIIAELAAENPLLAMGQDFGEAVGQRAGLRSALASPDPRALEHANDPWSRGAIVVAAVFDALFSIYQRRTVDLFRIFRAGGGRLQGNDVPEPLANRLCAEVERIATRVFNMCWRALDYCPAGAIELGDFLRACITADFEYSGDDLWGLRDAMMQAFRLRGIKSSTASFFTEDALRWGVIDSSTLNSRGPADLSQNAVRAFVMSNAKSLGGLPKAQLKVYPIEQAQLTAPDDRPQTTYFTQVLWKAARGMTLVFDGHGFLKYAICSKGATR
jgi:hypothetical protein